MARTVYGAAAVLTSKSPGHQDGFMRTTLTLEDDLAARLKERAHKTKRPFKIVVNEAIRAGLGSTGAAAVPPFKLKAKRLGMRPEFQNRNFNHVYEELEIDTFLDKNHRLRKP